MAYITKKINLNGTSQDNYEVSSIQPENQIQYEQTDTEVEQMDEIQYDIIRWEATGGYVEETPGRVFFFEGDGRLSHMLDVWEVGGKNFAS